MGEGQSRSSRRRDRDHSIRLNRPQEFGRARARATGPAGWLFAILALLGPGTSALRCVPAPQDEPPKVEALKPAPPGKRRRTSRKILSRRHRVSRRKTRPRPRSRRRPPPRSTTLRNHRRLRPKRPHWTEQSGSDAAGVPSLSSRFRFLERYGVASDPAHPELLTLYQVGVRERRKLVIEKAQERAPETVRKQSTVHLHHERVAQGTRKGEPTDLVRRYDLFEVKSPMASPPVDPRLLEGLQVWYHRRPPLRPQVTSLTSRPIREAEYRYIAEEVSIPQLMSFFPPAPVRLKEGWDIPARAVFEILGEQPDAEDFQGVTGTLEKVGTKAEDGKRLSSLRSTYPANSMHLSRVLQLDPCPDRI